MGIIFLYLLHGIVAAFLILAAVQDARKREVSNWIPIAIFILAALFMIMKQKLDLSGIVPGAVMPFYIFLALIAISGVEILSFSQRLASI